MNINKWIKLCGFITILLGVTPIMAVAKEEKWCSDEVERRADTDEHRYYYRHYFQSSHYYRRHYRGGHQNTLVTAHLAPIHK